MAIFLELSVLVRFVGYYFVGGEVGVFLVMIRIILSSNFVCLPG